MGRRKIQIKPIKDSRNRYVTFVKRKAGLFKKAHELAVLCQVDLALVIVTPDGKSFEYSTASDSSEVFDKRRRSSGIEQKRPSDYGAGSPDFDDDDDDDEASDPDKSVEDQQHQQQQQMQTQQQQHAGIDSSGAVGQSAGPPPLNAPISGPSQQIGARGHHKQHSSQQSIDQHTSRPKLTVQIPVLGDEASSGAGPGPLTALGQSDSVAEVAASTRRDVAEAQMGAVVQPLNAAPHAPVGEDPAAGSVPAAHAHGHAASIHAMPEPRMDALAGVSQGSSSSISQSPGHGEGSRPATMSRQPPAPHQHMIQSHLPVPQRFDQRNLPLSPGSAAQNFQPPMGYQNIFNQGIPMGYGYAPPGMGYGQPSSSTQKQPGMARGAPPAQMPPGMPPMGPGIPVAAGGAGVMTPNAGAPPSTGAAGNGGGGRWSGYPQSPLTYFMPPQGEQPGAKTEPGPISAIMPTRYMSEMLSPSNYFSMEWGVWDPQASAYPGGTARIVPPQNVQHPDKSQDQGTPSPVKNEPTSSGRYDSASKRRRAS